MDWIGLLIKKALDELFAQLPFPYVSVLPFRNAGETDSTEERLREEFNG